MSEEQTKTKQKKPRKSIHAEDVPLTPQEMMFIQMVFTGMTGKQIFDQLGFKYKPTPDNNMERGAKLRWLKYPNIQKKIKEIMAEMEKNTIMSATEVMEYFTAVARGEIKDQFGLDAPLSERTKAAQEIAKRTIDVDLKKEGLEDRNINVTLNWD